MTNHVHLLMTPASDSAISKTMQTLGRYYVQYYNYRYQRTGTLWEGRYKATLIDSERYLLTCMRYIELNPVRAGMASYPSEYPWSSYRQTALGQPDIMVTPHSVYRRLGRTVPERQAAYRQLFKARIANKTLAEIREATNKAWVLGNDRFKDKIERQLARRVSPLPKGGDRKSGEYRKKSKINRV
jgi:putative transposase